MWSDFVNHRSINTSSDSLDMFLNIRQVVSFRTGHTVEPFYFKGDTIDSMFFPLAGLYSSSFFENSEKLFITYSIPRFTPTRYDGKRGRYYWGSLLENLNSARIRSGVIFNFAEDSPQILAYPYTIFERDSVLLSLCCKRHILAEDKITIYPEDLILLLNSKLITPAYKPLYSKLKKTYLASIEDLGISVLTTSNPERWCFRYSPLKTIPNFRTIEERDNFLTNKVNQIFNGDF